MVFENGNSSLNGPFFLKAEKPTSEPKMNIAHQKQRRTKILAKKESICTKTPNAQKIGFSSDRAHNDPAFKRRVEI